MSRIKAVFVSLYHCSLVVLNIYLLDLIFATNSDEYLSAVPVMLAMGIAKMGASAFQAQQAKTAQRDAMIEAGKLGKQIADRKFINKFAALQVPTTGTELKMEQIARQAQAATEASKEAGARGVIGGTGRTVQAVADAGAQIAARLEDLQLRLDNKFLTEEQRVSLMNEKKDLQLDYQRLYGAQGAATQFGTQAAQAQAGVISGLGEAVAGGIEASALYGGDQEIDATDSATIDGVTYTTSDRAGADMGTIDPSQQSSAANQFGFIDPSQQSSAANQFQQDNTGLVGLEEQEDQNKFVDFFRNIFGKDDYFSGLGVSNKTERMLRKEYEI